MPLSVQGFNIGTDISVVIQDSSGDIIYATDLGQLMDFDAEAEDIELKIVPISNGGVPIIQDIPAGWRGSLMFTRVNGAFNQFRIDTENAFFDSGLIQQFTIQCSVLNRDLSVDEYQFIGVQFVKPRFGNFRADKEVDMRMDFRAARLLTTGASTPLLSLLAA